MRTAIIDYDMGNLGSVAKAVRFCGIAPEIVSAPAELARFDCAILPGVGNFGDGMENLRRSGMAEAVKTFIRSGKSLLGICLGMQMLLESSEEAPGVAGLGIFPGCCRRFPSGALKVPQISWNVANFAPSPLAAGLPVDPYFYFVHSYFVPPAEYTLARGEYIVPFSAAIGAGRCFATQFHPEKSQDTGLRLLKNFFSLAEGAAAK